MIITNVYLLTYYWISYLLFVFEFDLYKRFVRLHTEDEVILVVEETVLLADDSWGLRNA